MNVGILTFHFSDNYLNIDTYPEAGWQPEWFDTVVLLAWFAFTAAGIAEGDRVTLGNHRGQVTLHAKLFVGVPRVWEKFYSGVMIALKEASTLQQAAYAWGIGVGTQIADKVLALARDDTKIIPGHGPRASKADLKAYRDMLAAIAAIFIGLLTVSMQTIKAALSNPADTLRNE